MNDYNVINQLNDMTMELKRIEAYLHLQRRYDTEIIVSEALDKLATACNNIFKEVYHYE